MHIFDIAERRRVYEYVLQIAHSDARIVAGAVVGSLALSDGDRWSDLDLTFAVADSHSVSDVLCDWTSRMAREVDAVALFDLVRDSSIYRVFLLPGCLQCDLSFTPAAQFGAVGPRFRMLFGTSVEKAHVTPPQADELFGYAVHHAVRARVCIERGRFWQAHHWICHLRDYALHLACLRRSLPASEGRGFDDLPLEIRDAFSRTLITSLARGELMCALSCAIDGLLSERDGVEEISLEVAPRLQALRNE